MVLQFPCSARLCRASTATCGPREDLGCQPPQPRLGEEYIQYSKEQMEDFARFQDSQNTRKAYLAEAAELAYLGQSGGEWGLGLTELARDQIVNAVGYQLIPRYRLIGPMAVIVILVMFIVGMARMLIDILVRAIIIARVRGWGFWMFGALWDTAFQVAVSPFRWAVEKGKEGAGRIRNQMEDRAAYVPGQPQEE